ncbi:MAG: GNAT family N-acetyltransferase [Geodermatophilaceae bacterium]|nr:GNAT family N-acetyltransferase [Geodermatophilaceae bacterium]
MQCSENRNKVKITRIGHTFLAGLGRLFVEVAVEGEQAWRPRTVLFRELEPARDVELARELLAAQHAAHAFEAALIQDDRIPPMHEGLSDLCSASLCWLGAFVDDRLVGAVAWVEGLQEYEIDRLIVLPDSHRTGVGTWLVREVLTRAGPTHAVVSTGQANIPARPL